jgi:dTDP-4-dehydrorhamnose 3,5-epimerase
MSIAIHTLSLQGPKLIKVKRFGDERGFFCETYSTRDFADAGITDVFVQDNHSFSADAGTIRGFHFQLPPHEQSKLLYVVRGAVLDVAVDLRAGSSTYGKHVAVELSAENALQLYVPAGFAHGFCTLVPDTAVYYKVTALYAPNHESGILWNDPELAIAWPSFAGSQLSEKDRNFPRLAEFESPFA